MINKEQSCPDLNIKFNSLNPSGRYLWRLVDVLKPGWLEFRLWESHFSIIITYWILQICILYLTLIFLNIFKILYIIL